MDVSVTVVDADGGELPNASVNLGTFNVRHEAQGSRAPRHGPGQS